MRFSTFVIAIFVPVYACGAVIHVADDQLPTQGDFGDARHNMIYSTIQAAIDAAQDGDTVLIAPGVYTGDGNRDVVFYGRTITVLAEGDAIDCVIDCQGSESEPHRGFLFVSQEGPGTVIKGLSIINGWADDGGAIFLGSETEPTISNCRFVNNHALRGGAIGGTEPSRRMALNGCWFESNSADYGGAINGGSVPSGVRDCQFIGNHVTVLGSAVAGTLARYVACLFDGNTGPGYVIHYKGLIDSCLFIRNQGSVIYSQGAFMYPSKQVRHSTFYDNDTVFHMAEDGGLDLYDVLIAHNKGPAATCYSCGGCPYTPHPSLYNCNLYGNLPYGGDCVVSHVGTQGNISEDPLFCDTANDNFGLHFDSPCIGAGYDGGDIGLYGVNCGPVAVDQDETFGSFMFCLSQNRPNPFNAATSIEYTMPEGCRVSLAVYNLLGQRVRILVESYQSAGRHEITWDGRDDGGHEVASGLYLYRISAGDDADAKTMVLLK